MGTRDGCSLSAAQLRTPAHPGLDFAPKALRGRGGTNGLPSLLPGVPTRLCLQLLQTPSPGVAVTATCSQAAGRRAPPQKSESETFCG